MFRKVRDFDNSCKRSSSESFRESYIESGDFIYHGVDAHYYVRKASSGYGRVVVTVSYDKSVIPWLDRDSWESGCSSWLRNQLSEYSIACINF